MPTTTRTRIVENTWKCLHCKAMHPEHINRGRDMECSKCGAPKGANIIDKIPEAGAARDAAEIKSGHSLHSTFSQDSNWACEYCKGQVRAANGKCEECGGNKDKAKTILELRQTSSKLNDIGGSGPYGKYESPNSSTKFEPDKTPYKVHNPSSSTVSKNLGVKQNAGFRDSAYEISYPDISNKIPLKSIAIFTAIIIGFIGFIWLMVFLFSDHNSKVLVEQTHWAWTRQAQHDDQMHDNGSWEREMHPRVIQGSVTCEDRIRNTFTCSPGTATAHSCQTHEECTHVPDTCTRNPDICTTVNVPETCSTSPRSCREVCTDRGNGSSSCTETCSGGDRTCTGGGTRQDCRSVPDTCTPNPDHCEDVTVCVCDNHENWCAYDYMQWNVTAQATTQGNDHNVRPDPHIVVDPSDPRQRLIDEVHYSVKLSDGPSNQWTYVPRGLEDFNRFNTGDHWMLRWNRAGTTIQPIRRVP